MNTIWIVMPILIVLMFLLGIDLDRTAFAGVRRQPKVVMLGMFGQLLLLSLIAFAVAWALNLPPVYFMGLVLVAAVLSAALLILLAMACSSLLSRLGGFGSAVRRTIVIEVGMQNAAQAIAIASSPFIFNSGEMALPAIIYALLMNVILLTYVYCIRKKQK